MEQEDLEDLLREVKKLRRLEQAVRTIVEDDDYEAGGIGHHGSCNTNHAWGSNANYCDCYAKDVHQALEALSGTILDDIVDALEGR